MCLVFKGCYLNCVIPGNICFDACYGYEYDNRDGIVMEYVVFILTAYTNWMIMCIMNGIMDLN